MRLLRTRSSEHLDLNGSDDELVRLSRAGNQDAFGVLYERHFSSLFGFAYRMLGDATEAEDAAHDSLTRAWSKLSLYQNGDFRAWLFTITLNVIRDRARLRAKTSSATQLRDDQPDAHSTEDDALTIVAVRDLEDLLAQLTPRARTIVCLKLSGLRYAEIADVVGKSPASVAQDYSRTIKRLALAMEQGGGRLVSTGKDGSGNV